MNELLVEEEYVFLDHTDLRNDVIKSEPYFSSNNNSQTKAASELENIVLYEKMVDTTSTWQMDHKYTKTSSCRKDFPINSSFMHNILQKKKTSKLSGGISQKWADIFNNQSAVEALGYWVVTEKVHGANFCFVYDVATNTVNPAKRTALLDGEDEFFGYRAAYEAELPRVMAVFQQTATRFPNATIIYAFAELFGGVYPEADHISVNRFSEVSVEEVVQREIQYSPCLHFYHFDLAVQQHAREKTYLNYKDSAVIWESADVLWAKPLFIGSFEEVTNCGVDFQTTIPSQLGLRPIPDNAAEGVVIKPLIEISVKPTTAEDRRVKSQGIVKSADRAIVKRKALKFLEKVAVMNNTAASRNHKKMSADNSTNYQDNESQYHAVLAHMMSYVNVNRIAAARSKLGSRVAAAVIVGAVIQDILNTAEDEEEGEEEGGGSPADMWGVWMNGLKTTQRDSIIHKLEVAVTQLLAKAR